MASEVAERQIMSAAKDDEPARGMIPDSKKAEIESGRPEIEIQSRWGPHLQSAAAIACARAVPPAYVCKLFIVEGLFSLPECAALLGAAEAAGFGATNYPKAYRGNLRLITTDVTLSAAVWERCRSFVPAVVTLREPSCAPGQHAGARRAHAGATTSNSTWRAVGLNECWRLAKYHEGDRFERHCDAHFARNGDEMSMFTLNVYMSDGFAGGSTRFYASDGGGHRVGAVDLEVRPEAGLAVIFRQPPEEHLVHDGEPLGPGSFKYLFRSDVMYRRERGPTRHAGGREAEAA